MKKRVLNAFLLLGLLISLPAIPVDAQSNILVGRVEIPFDFTVRDKTLPAGTYRVWRLYQDKSALLLRNDDGDEAVEFLTIPTRASKISETGKLVFHRYGESYFLHQIWEPGVRDGRQLPKSRRERSVERDLASNGAKPAKTEHVVTTQ